MEAKYTASGSIQFTLDGVEWTVPSLGSPTHIGGKLREFVESGGVIEPYVAPPPPLPTQVTPRQARLALNAAGLLASTEALINAADPATKITWEYATVFERHNPLIVNLGAQLNLTDEQIDNLFLAASQL
jgi:hypothetical protein